jgi:hypothetical protein
VQLIFGDEGPAGNPRIGGRIEPRDIAGWGKSRTKRPATRGLLAVLPEKAATSDACLGPVVENGDEVVAVSQETFTRALADAPIPPQARLDAAQASGVAEAITLAQRLMSEPRDLKLAPTTPEADRTVGQPILFALGGLDPDWGSGVGVVVDWRDGSDPKVTDAQKLRQGDRLEHPYGEVGTVRPGCRSFFPCPARRRSTSRWP